MLRNSAVCAPRAARPSQNCAMRKNIDAPPCRDEDRDFVASLEKGLAANSLEAYERDLRQFDAASIRKLSDTLESDIEAFLKQLREQQQKSTSIARRRTWRAIVFG